MKMKRIIAGLLSFILIASSPMTAMATEADTAKNTVSGNEAVLEMPENADGEETVSENTVSENSVSENSVSENSVSENAVDTTENVGDLDISQVQEETGIPSEYSELVQEAKADLQGYLEQKDIFAVVYLTDFYPVKAKPYKDADTVISVPSARTVQILGMDVEWEYKEEWEEYIPTVWYETQFYE